ncbi:MAG: nicotinate phosphoribosyltransferase [Nitrospirae bacterium]|nr:MAG: nicotinate phosphoribosyltransferase [Nitrospirota bacterium]
MFHVATPEDILEGRITDVYFQRTLKILKDHNLNPLVKAEFIAKTLPQGWPWAVFAGLEEVLYLLERVPVKVRALKEGTVFYPGEPVMEIEGHYQDFCIYETAVLGLICQATGVATKAARFKKLADGRLVVSFGARRMHPILAPMIERNAYIGGCDGVAVVKSGEIIGTDPMGTMPHALILCMGSTVEALKAYDKSMPEEVKRVALIDTFNDEKFEAINVAEALGERLFAVRLDTPSSRRGDFLKILQEVRWELDLRGHNHVKIFVSGGIKEEDVPVLNQVVDAYGIGTSISNAPVVDYSMDIVEVEGRAIAKRGKLSGSKALMLCPSCGNRKTIPFTEGPHQCDRCGEKMEDILTVVLDNGKRLVELPSPKDIRQFVLEQIEHLEVL